MSAWRGRAPSVPPALVAALLENGAHGVAVGLAHVAPALPPVRAPAEVGGRVQLTAGAAAALRPAAGAMLDEGQPRRLRERLGNF